MATLRATLAERTDSGAWSLAVGDLVVLAAVFSAGTVHHNGLDYPFADPVGWGLTLLPFLIGWAVVAPPVGAYSPGAAESAKAAVPLAIRAWLPAAILALGLRASPLFAGGAAPVFVVVSLVSGGVGLAVWRWLAFRIG
jgi:hypothetical protein